MNKKIEDCESSLFFFQNNYNTSFFREIEKVLDEVATGLLSDKNQDEVLEKHCQYLGPT